MESYRLSGTTITIRKIGVIPYRWTKSWESHNTNGLLGVHRKSLRYGDLEKDLYPCGWRQLDQERLGRVCTNGTRHGWLPFRARLKKNRKSISRKIERNKNLSQKRRKTDKQRHGASGRRTNRRILELRRTDAVRGYGRNFKLEHLQPTRNDFF